MYLHTCMCIHAYCTCIHAYIHTVHGYMHVHTCILCMHTCIHTYCTCIHACAYIHTYILCMHTCLHTYCTCILNSTQPSWATEPVTTEREAVTRASLFLPNPGRAPPQSDRGQAQHSCRALSVDLQCYGAAEHLHNSSKRSAAAEHQKMKIFKLATHFSQVVHQSLKLSRHSTLRRCAAFLHSTSSQNASNNSLQQVLVPQVDGQVKACTHPC